jgi:hypothetical protein
LKVFTDKNINVKRPSAVPALPEAGGCFNEANLWGDDVIGKLQKIANTSSPNQNLVLQFCGHGKDGKLAFANRRGNEEETEVEVFAQLIAQCKPSCVILNACETELLGRVIIGKCRALQPGIIPPVVICWATGAGTGVCAEFSLVFYGKLCDALCSTQSFKSGLKHAFDQTLEHLKSSSVNNMETGKKNVLLCLPIDGEEMINSRADEGGGGGGGGGRSGGGGSTSKATVAAPVSLSSSSAGGSSGGGGGGGGGGGSASKATAVAALPPADRGHHHDEQLGVVVDLCDGDLAARGEGMTMFSRPMDSDAEPDRGETAQTIDFPPPFKALDWADFVSRWHACELVHGIYFNCGPGPTREFWFEDKSPGKTQADPYVVLHIHYRKRADGKVPNSAEALKWVTHVNARWSTKADKSNKNTYCDALGRSIPSTSESLNLTGKHPYCSQDGISGAVGTGWCLYDYVTVNNMQRLPTGTFVEQQVLRNHFLVEFGGIIDAACTSGVFNSEVEFDVKRDEAGANYAGKLAMVNGQMPSRQGKSNFGKVSKSSDGDYDTLKVRNYAFLTRTVKEQEAAKVFFLEERKINPAACTNATFADDITFNVNREQAGVAYTALVAVGGKLSDTASFRASCVSKSSQKGKELTDIVTVQTDLEVATAANRANVRQQFIAEFGIYDVQSVCRNMCTLEPTFEGNGDIVLIVNRGQASKDAIKGYLKFLKKLPRSSTYFANFEITDIELDITNAAEEKDVHDRITVQNSRSLPNDTALRRVAIWDLLLTELEICNICDGGEFNIPKAVFEVDPTKLTAGYDFQALIDTGKLQDPLLLPPGANFGAITAKAKRIKKIGTFVVLTVQNANGLPVGAEQQRRDFRARFQTECLLGADQCDGGDFSDHFAARSITLTINRAHADADYAADVALIQKGDLPDTTSFSGIKKQIVQGVPAGHDRIVLPVSPGLSPAETRVAFLSEFSIENEATSCSAGKYVSGKIHFKIKRDDAGQGYNDLIKTKPFGLLGTTANFTSTVRSQYVCTDHGWRYEIEPSVPRFPNLLATCQNHVLQTCEAAILAHANFKPLVASSPPVALPSHPTLQEMLLSCEAIRLFRELDYHDGESLADYASGKSKDTIWRSAEAAARRKRIQRATDICTRLSSNPNLDLQQLRDAVDLHKW